MTSSSTASSVDWTSPHRSKLTKCQAVGELGAEVGLHVRLWLHGTSLAPAWRVGPETLVVVACCQVTLDSPQGKVDSWTRDLTDIVKWARSQRWSVEQDRKGYTRFYDPEGNYITDYPATPSNPRRRMADLQVALKRAGLQIPPPSKSEQRAQRRKDSR